MKRCQYCDQLVESLYDCRNTVIDNLRGENENLQRELKYLVETLDDLIASSTGVCGLHLNGDDASWGELQEGGQFQEWLQPFDEARRHWNERK